jgi:hypothetical protein
VLERLISASWDAITLWDVSDRQGLKRIVTLDDGGSVRQPLRNPSNESSLYTNRGFIDLNEGVWDAVGRREDVILHPCRGYGLNSDLTWIMKDGKKALWLSPKYRPRDDLGIPSQSNVVLRGSVMLIACRMGTLLLLHFSEDGEVSMRRY